MEDSELIGIRPPIIAEGDGDTAIYESVEHAESYYCLFDDVEDVEFFDSTGTILHAQPGDRWAVKLEATERRDAESLRQALVRYLRSIGEPIGDAAPLDWLIERRVDRERHPRPLFKLLAISSRHRYVRMSEATLAQTR